MSKYGETFLTRPRLMSRDADFVDSNWMIWTEAEGGISWPRPLPSGGKMNMYFPKAWTCSLLGMINGLLINVCKLPYCLVCYEDEDTHEVLKYTFRRKWF